MRDLWLTANEKTKKTLRGTSSGKQQKLTLPVITGGVRRGNPSFTRNGNPFFKTRGGPSVRTRTIKGAILNFVITKKIPHRWGI